jgi:hypothetical protein
MKFEKPEFIKENKENKEEQEEYYFDKTHINGIDFQVGWDNNYKDYTIYFPQIIIGDDARDRGVEDSIIRISENAKTAKLVFEYVKLLAEQEDDIFELYKKIEKLIEDLPE